MTLIKFTCIGPYATLCTLTISAVTCYHWHVTKKCWSSAETLVALRTRATRRTM